MSRRRIMSVRGVACAALALHAGLSVRGEVRADDEPILPTVTRMGVMLDRVGTTSSAQVQVISRADIERIGAADIGQLLRRVAGVVIDGSAGTGGFASLYLRGADPSHVVVLVDGVRQNDPLSSRGAAVDINTLALADIERIDILRGPVAAAGDAALAGVIDIRTRASRSAGTTTHGTVAAGGDGYRDAAVRLGGVEHRLAAFASEDGEGGLAGRSRVRGASGGHRFAIGPALNLDGHWRIARSESEGAPDDSGGLRWAEYRTPEHRESEHIQLALQLVPAAGDWRLALNASQRDSDDVSPGVAPGLRDPMGLPAQLADGRYERQQLTWQQSLRPSSRWQVDWGADAEHERGRLDAQLFYGIWLPAAFERQRDRYSLFARVSHAGDQLSTDAGLRATREDDGTVTWQPAWSALWVPPDRAWQLGIDAAATRQPPSFYALGSPLIGDPALEDEQARHLELHAAWNDSAAWQARVALYRAQYRDLIDFDAGPPPRLVNRSRVDVTGVEARATWRLADDWSLSAQGNWMDVDTGEAGVELRHRPRAQASIDVDGDLADRWQVHASARWLAARFDSSVPTSDQSLPGHAVLDASLRYRADRWEVFLAVDNLLGRDYELVIGVPAPSRRLRIGLGRRF